MPWSCLFWQSWVHVVRTRWRWSILGRRWSLIFHPSKLNWQLSTVASSYLEPRYPLTSMSTIQVKEYNIFYPNSDYNFKFDTRIIHFIFLYHFAFMLPFFFTFSYNFTYFNYTIFIFVIFMTYFFIYIHSFNNLIYILGHPINSFRGAIYISRRIL